MTIDKMNSPILSTYKILMMKAFNQDIDEGWVEWAIEMMEAGYESDNLYILAGESRPYNQFELQVLTNKVLKDLNLHYNNKERAINNYVYFLVSTTIDCPETYSKTLRELKNICIDENMYKEYIHFYLLYFAKDDLNESEVQWYWEGADRRNIDFVIRNEFKRFLDQFENERQKTTA